MDAVQVGDKRPVWFGFHGGALTRGRVNAAYDGDCAGEKGVVLVTINYRIGPLGYLAIELTSESPQHSSAIRRVGPDRCVEMGANKYRNFRRPIS